MQYKSNVHTHNDVYNLDNYPLMLQLPLGIIMLYINITTDVS